MSQWRVRLNIMMCFIPKRFLYGGFQIFNPDLSRVLCLLQFLKASLIPTCNLIHHWLLQITTISLAMQQQPSLQPLWQHRLYKLIHCMIILACSIIWEDIQPY